jgi:carbamoyltransferase
MTAGGRYVLGIGYTTHDISAALVRSGELVAAVARERLSRRKHDGGVSGGGGWDASACIDYCLEVAGIPLERVDLFVENHLQNVDFHSFHEQEVARFKRPYPIEKTIMISHHLAHAYSTFYGSGFDDALVLVVDGEGNSRRAIATYQGEDGDRLRQSDTDDGVDPNITEKISLYRARRGAEMTLLRKDFTVGSLGGAYDLVTIHIFDQRDEAGKTMGLAPYGKSGRFQFDLIRSQSSKVTYPYLNDAMNMVMPQPIKQWPEDPSKWSDDHRFFADLAWKVQDDLEGVLVDIAKTARREYGMTRLCIAGGVGLNSVSNKLILDQSGFEDLFIVPSSGDDGISIGCAYWGTHHGSTAAAGGRLRNAYTGRVYPEETIEAALGDPRLCSVRLDESALLECVVSAIAEGRIVGWFEGGSEIGPRALGHRSILGDARRAEMVSILNRRVKFREAFRPFAPVVPLENVSEYFELDRPSPYMLLIAPVHKEKRSVIPAITHVDGTARVQTVTEEENGRFYRLVRAFGAATGVPVIINTSFNIKGEPIVETPAEAVSSFLRADMDLLVLEDFVIEKT